MKTSQSTTAKVTILNLDATWNEVQNYCASEYDIKAELRIYKIVQLIKERIEKVEEAPSNDSGVCDHIDSIFLSDPYIGRMAYEQAFSEKFNLSRHKSTVDRQWSYWNEVLITLDLLGFVLK